MLIELAHYTIIFAVAAVGLQTFLMLPTLWSGGSAVAIKLGFRGASFTTALLAFSFCVLLRAFAVYDFSLAVVFETFDTQSSAFYALPAFCSSREGLFFTLIIILSVFSLAGYSKADLPTYQERGRYLFATGFFLFFMLVLMLATADPFTRIAEPPFEGAGFHPTWRAPYKILEVLLMSGSFSALTVSAAKMLSLYSKGHRFVKPALRGSIIALIGLTGVSGMRLLTGFTTAEDGALWQWTPANTLPVAVWIITAGQVMLLFSCSQTRLFTGWIIAFAVIGLSFCGASFFCNEYRLFALSADEVYFPNPVTALSAIAGLICFLLFLSAVMAKKRTEDNSFFVLSRESFIGLAAASLLSAGLCLGGLALLPSLFMFLPDLPLRLLPALTVKVLTGAGIAFTVFFAFALRRCSLTKGFVKTDWRVDVAFWTIAALAGLIVYGNVSAGDKVVLYSLPAVLILDTLIALKPPKLPSSFTKIPESVKRVGFLTGGMYLCAAGFLIFSVQTTHTALNTQSRLQQVDINTVSDALPCRVETLSEKTNAGATRYRLICPNGDDEMQTSLLSGKTFFQWQDRKLHVRLWQSGNGTVSLTEAIQTRENEITVRRHDYPRLNIIGSGLFLMCAGMLLWLLSLGKRGTA